MGAELRNDRGTPPRLARVSTDVQRAVDAGEVRLSESSPSATRFRRAGRGSVEVITFKLLSKNPGALHPEVVLGGGASLLGGEAVPGNGLSVILWDAFAGAVPQPEVVLRLGVASLSESAQVGEFLC